MANLNAGKGVGELYVWEVGYNAVPDGPMRDEFTMIWEGRAWDVRVFGEVERNLYMLAMAYFDEGDDGKIHLKPEFDETKGGSWPSGEELFVYFKRVVDLLWNEDGRSTRRVIWNEWAVRMFVGMLGNQYLGLAGCASSGKSDAMAVYAIVMYLCWPQKTKCIATSTTMKMAKMRIWRSVNELWRKDFPGKMVYSDCVIKGVNAYGDLTEDTGILLMPAAGGAGQEIDSNFLGLKQERFIVLLDELSELPVSVVNGCYSNLSTNTWFEMKAASNPNSYHDAFGVFCKPKNGWASVTELDMEWETSRGMCLRFDSEQSPNMKAGKALYPWLPKKRDIEHARREFGERSRYFFRMFKAFWFAGSSDETVFNEGEIMKGKADTPIDKSEIDVGSREELVLSGDPAFTQGGDRFPLMKGRVVQIDKKSVLEILDLDIIKDDIDNEDVSRSYSAIRYIKGRCAKEGIKSSHFGFDMTGAGIPFRDIVVAEWSSLPMGVMFGGKASDMQISPVDPRMASEVYANRVTELWARLKGLMREGRIRGLTSEIISELVQRQWDEMSRSKLKIESKKVMKLRTGKSPDIADCLVILVELCIQLGLLGEMETVKIDDKVNDTWQKTYEALDSNAWDDSGLEWD
jgi:hypothetical protein